MLTKEIGTLCWPDGVDIAPETLYHEATGEPLPAWMKSEKQWHEALVRLPLDVSFQARLIRRAPPPNFRAYLSMVSRNLNTFIEEGKVVGISILNFKKRLKRGRSEVRGIITISGSVLRIASTIFVLRSGLNP